MYKRIFFKFILLLLLFFVGSFSYVHSLSPSYLFLNNNLINTSNVRMLLLVTPSENFSSGSELTILFPSADDTKWCKQDNFNVSVNGVSSSIINISGWQIDSSLPGSLSGRCYQGVGPNSHDRIVITGIGELTSGTSYAVQINPNVNLSTGPNVGSNNIVVQLKRGLVVESTAFAIYLQSLGGVYIDAFVDEDYTSTVQVLNSPVEKGIWSNVRVRVLDSKGNPIPGRNIVLGLDLSNQINWEIEQPSGLTNSNGVVTGRVRGLETRMVKVTATDKSFSQDVKIQDFDWLNVINVPTITLHQLPMYTIGLSREITWNPLSGDYMYFIECSLDPNFSTLYKTSGWITGGKYTFENLEYGKAYYYRGKVKNIADFESVYSNVVTSIQAEKPTGSVEVLDPIVEKGIWSRVRVHVLDSEGNPMSGRKVVLNIDRSDLTNWEIQQPTNLTNSNGITEGRIRGFEVATVKVTAIDQTMPMEFYLDGFDWLQVKDVPTFSLHSLPKYTRGLSRRITWNLRTGVYQYYIESSTDPNFSTVRNSGWISTNQYLFENLEHGVAYYYRGKLRNSANIESPFSETVSSIQDNRGPRIELVDFEILSREAGNKGRFTFLITDMSGVGSVRFLCKGPEGNQVNCGRISSLNNFHYVTFDRESLVGYEIGGGEYLLEYCLEAIDFVGNKRVFCEEEKFFLERVVQEEEVEEEEEVIEEEVEEEIVVPRETVVARVLNPVRKTIEDTVAYVQDLEVDDSRIELASTAIVSTAVPITIISFFTNLLPIGQVFMGLFGIFRRKKRILPYGYVYDSVTKEPVNRAIVRIYKDGKLVATTVTNVYGVFNANLEPGEYFLKVLANTYTYPSKLISGNSDGNLQNIYLGGVFVVEEEEPIQYSIPVDPLDSSSVEYFKTTLVNYLSKIFLALQKVLIFMGFLIALFLYFRNPVPFNLGILLFYVPLIFLHLFLSVGERKHSFGVVKDEYGNLLNGVFLGLREMEFEKLVTRRVADAKGRYKFLVPGGRYKLEVLNKEYEIKSPKAKSLIFEGSVKKPLLINTNLVLVRKNGV